MVYEKIGRNVYRQVISHYPAGYVDEMVIMNLKALFEGDTFRFRDIQEYLIYRNFMQKYRYKLVGIVNYWEPKELVTGSNIKRRA